jgi:tRNA-specific 2-thiouridylase
MSGGVDSSVAAALLKRQGHDVVGVTMSIWGGGSVLTEGRRHGCYGPEVDDIHDARSVAETLGISFRVLDMRSEYEAYVLAYFRQEYLRGRTPNPCIRCNPRVKLGAMVAKARAQGIGFERVATGHYARVEHDSSRGRYLLRKSRDLRKDQSYFLCYLSQEQLALCMFPIGDLTKSEVRDIARSLGLQVGDKPESQDFVAGDYLSLLGNAGGTGPIVDRQGNVLGEHRGIHRFTVGQRKGLRIDAPEPLYVLSIDAARNAVVVGTKEETYGNQLVASDVNWVAIERLDAPMRARARIRYHHREAQAMVTPTGDSGVHVQFDEPQMAITPGQAVVFYDGDVVIGGGIIDAQAGSVSSYNCVHPAEFQSG